MINLKFTKQQRGRLSHVYIHAADKRNIRELLRLDGGFDLTLFLKFAQTRYSLLTRIY